MNAYKMLIIAVLLSSCSAPVDINSPGNSCGLKPQTGQCKAYFPRYYFNAQTNFCEVFIWGGCGGVVPFETLPGCQQVCEQ